jgi:hypothetical protein
VSQGYVSIAARLTPDQRAQVERGSLALSRIYNNPDRDPDAEIDALVERIGLAAFCTRLHRFMEPKFELPTAAE